MSKIMSKYLGIDWGEKKIGLAFGSSETGLALARGIVENNTRVFNYIESICRDEEIDIVVAGRLRDENERFNKFLDFLKTLEVKVELADERMSTKMAGKLNKDLKGQDDAIAAALILQDWMDRMKALRH